MNCSEARPLLPLFLDGELDGRQMRGVALHSTKCPECEQEIREMERLQDLFAGCLNARVDEIDPGEIWAGVESRIGNRSVSWRPPLLRWRESIESAWFLKAPTFAALAAAAILALLFWRSGTHVSPNPVQVADNSAIIDTLDSHVDNFAVFSEPESNTMVLWISDDGSGGGGGTEELP